MDEQEQRAIAKAELKTNRLSREVVDEDPRQPKVTPEEAADLRAEVEENEDPEDRDLIDLEGRDQADQMGTERDYVDDEHPEDEDGDISPYRTEGEPLEFLSADDKMKDAATLGGKYSGGGRHR
jgi:hypothetical protein